MDPENLRAVPLFAQMAQEDLQRIATFAAEDSAPAGMTLVREGDFSNDMVAIESGTADVIRGGGTIGTLGPGDVFGEIGVLGRETRTATIVATSPMRLVRLTSWEVKRLPREVRDRLAELVESRRAGGRADTATPG
jgi:cAMP-dependent protein kinase regulator